MVGSHGRRISKSMKLRLIQICDAGGTIDDLRAFAAQNGIGKDALDGFINSHTPREGCRFCRFNAMEPTKRPCTKCARSYKDLFAPDLAGEEKADSRIPEMVYAVAAPSSKAATVCGVPQPLYTYGDLVRFGFNAKNGWTELVGSVEVVDARGTFEQKEEPSYDVYVRENNTLYKHIRQSWISEKTGSASPENRLP